MSLRPGPPAAPGPFTPFTWLESWIPPIPSTWIDCGLRGQDYSYYLDSSTWDGTGWRWDSSVYYEKREVNGGFYYYFGFSGPGMQPMIWPPGTFSIEAVVVLYWAADEIELKGEPGEYHLVDELPAENQEGEPEQMR